MDWSCNELTSYVDAIKVPAWQRAMKEEFTALTKNQTWDLVPLSSNCHLMCNKWIFKLKRGVHGTIVHYKARLVAQGFSQWP